jgi:hypothetical protein
MSSHKFKVGETVLLQSSVIRNVPGGVYEVTKQLPDDGRSPNIGSRAQPNRMSASRGKAS